MSSIQLLWFFQAIIRSNYSYEYFKKAIEECFLAIEYNPDIDEEIKINALFFASVTAAELGVKDPFDYLIKQHKDQLPILIGLGVKYEGNKLEMKTDILKNHINRISTQIKKNLSVKRFVKSLYEKPIESLQLR